MFDRIGAGIGECEIAMAETGPHAGVAQRIAAGLAAGMRVETAAGWRPVEALAPGDLVHTLDGGLRPVRRVARRSLGATLWTAYPEGVVFVPGGAFGNCAEFYLLPEQMLWVEGAAVEAVAGLPGALIPGAALEGMGGAIRVMPVDGLDLVTPVFDEEEVIWANSGVPVHCPGTRPLAVTGGRRSAFFEVLDTDQARAVLAQMAGEDARPHETWARAA